MKIAFDLDDVLSCFNLIWHQYHNKHYGTKVTMEDITDFYLPTVYKVPLDVAMQRVFEFYRSEEAENIPIEPGAIMVTQELKKRGHALYVLTSRDPEIKDKTVEWININLPNTFKEVIFTKQFSLSDGFNNNVKKSDACKKYGIDMLVEDAPLYAMDVAEAGLIAVLVEKNWNKNFKDPNKNLYRVKNITEILQLPFFS